MPMNVARRAKQFFRILAVAGGSLECRDREVICEAHTNLQPSKYQQSSDPAELGAEILDTNKTIVCGRLQ